MFEVFVSFALLTGTMGYLLLLGRVCELEKDYVKTCREIAHLYEQNSRLAEALGKLTEIIGHEDSQSSQERNN